MSPSKLDWSKIDPSQLNITSVSRRLSPEERAESKRRAELADQDKAWVRAEADRIHEESMRNGTVPRMARYVLMQERKQQGLSDDEMIARSGLDATALASMAGRDAHPTIETMEAYARALGKKLLIAFADEEPEAQESPSEPVSAKGAQADPGV
jgi:ribosome-binding protein aMBF1 (putative translation factor)